MGGQRESQTDAAAGSGRGPVHRWLILGLDGATFSVLEPLMQEGLMPNLQSLIRSGSAGILYSTKPPMTPAAWTTFMTGKGPGRHGIIDFERYDPHTGTLSFNSTFEIREKTIWEILSQKGFVVGSIHLPMTYPPKPVNGFVISGFETPSVEVDFTWPRELKDEILRRFPDYSYQTNWQRSLLNGDATFRANLDYIKKTFWQGYDLGRFCTERYDWDVLMVLLKFVDNLQHKAWRYIDPQSPVRAGRRAAMVRECFSELDAVIGKFAEFARQRDAALMIMSDHGHGSLDGKAQPNLLLKKWGYLRLRSIPARVKTRTSYLLHRLFRKKVPRFAEPSMSIDRELAVDWSRTVACVMHAGIYGFLYINLKGRQPTGIVEPQDYERLRDEIQRRLSEAAVRAPDGSQIRIFAEVHKAEELYNCRRQEHPWLPDLVLVPNAGLAVVRKIRGFSPVRWLPPRRREGTHRIEGILVASGRGIKSGLKIDAGIVDIAPTLLAGLGLPVPIDMEGKVLTDIFAEAMEVQYEPPQRKVAEVRPEEVYTAEQRREVERRLADLGYLE